MDERTRVLNMIAEDMKEDSKSFDGRPFNGRTVAEYFGNQGAAIAALAKIMIVDKEKEDESKDSKENSTQEQLADVKR